MCGIVGVVGQQDAAPRLLEALRRLEYRGYDSAGIATLVNGHIDRRRAEGKLVNLAHVLEREPLEGRTGIGHTRWATHGAPTERNAHPHGTRRVSVVHNGIIENFRALRDEVIGMGFPPDRVVTIHNGVDLSRFRPGPGDRARFGLPEGVPTGIFVGDIQTSRKNLDSVLKALAVTPGVHLAVVGKAEGSAFPAMAERLGVADRCHFIGFMTQDDVAAAFRSTDFFVFPSRYETSGLVLLEAAATGLPLITARSVGGAGIFAPDGALISSDPEDVAFLTKSMLRLRDDPQLAVDLSRAAQAIAERQTWAAATQRYLDLFERLADSRSPMNDSIDLRLSKGV